MAGLPIPVANGDATAQVQLFLIAARGQGKANASKMR